MEIQPLAQQEFAEVASLLTASFYPQIGWQSWFTPIFEMGINHDLHSRLSHHSSSYSCLMGAHRPVSTSTTATLIGTVEVALKSLCSWSLFGMLVPYISNLAVDSRYRSQGIGRQLLLNCEPVVRQWGYDALYLHVLENNTAARRLYASLGYQVQRKDSSLLTSLMAQPQRLLLYKQL
ncbi:MAG: GNAT family N-acetyltransferase [Acaryochloridaceae cyanobacterium SU_2_1]|nr:GNAT family N-acetyltransferase [Acaryochloridaceae cyanobacterium SU_2_1]